MRSLAPGEAPGDAHVLFVGPDSARRLGALALEAPRGTLVVADGEEALEHGAMIGFVAIEDRLRFAVALDAAEQAGLRISSRMLSVAAEVKGRRP